jgi:uncharacterized protein (DUF2345 family)
MDPDNSIKVIRTRSGVQIRIDDRAGQESLTLETPSGQTVVLQDGPGSIELRDSGGSQVVLEAGGITVTTPGKVTIQAGQVEISAGIVAVNASLSQFSGVVRADSVIANSVVTPGGPIP